MPRTLAYRLLLRLLPHDTRARHGDQMLLVYEELLAEARRTGRVRAARVVTRELLGLARFAWRERRGAPRQHLHAGTPRTAGRPPMIGTLVQDLRFAARLLRRSPSFALVGVVTMALAVGANTAIFSVVNSVVLRSLPFADPDRLVVLGHHVDGRADLSSTTPGNLHDWMQAATAFESIAGFSVTERIVTAHGNAERLRGGISVGDLFSVLGRQAAEGRTLRASDDHSGAAPVVVLSSRLARRLFGESPAVGQALAINGVSHAIVGVMPADFAFFDYDYEYWVPARFDAAFRLNRDQYFLLGIARLGESMDIIQANAQLNTVMDAIRREYPQFTQNAVAAVLPMKSVLLDGVETRLLLLMGAVGFVLLIACANLGNLLLARAAGRRREMAVRHALGADGVRLVRQMLAESVLLAFIGGLAGLAVGAGLLRLLVTYLPETLPRRDGISLDATVLLFTLAVSSFAGLLFGVFPALQIAGGQALDPLREGSRSTARTGAIRRGLVASQMALALMLLVSAGLLLRSFGHLIEVPPGFATERLLTFSVSLPGEVYRTSPDRVSFFERAVTALEAIPGVRSVTLTSTLPVAGRGNGAWFNIVDRPLPPTETPPSVPNRVVRPNYFQALGIPLVRGRAFTDGDGREGVRAVIISESVARRFFAGVDPIGQRIYMGAPDNRVVPDSEIVGIVADVKQTSLSEEQPEAVYAPHRLVPTMTSLTFAVRTAGDPASIGTAAREAVRQIDPSVPVVRLQTMDNILKRAAAPARSSVVLVGLFAVVALTLSLVGVYGVLSYTVSQQTTELGIRLALGASARQVQLLVVSQGMRPVATGIAIGLLGALLLSRFMQTLLFNVTPTDALTYGAVALILSGTAVATSYLPARRAMRLDPVKVLRAE